MRRPYIHLAGNLSNWPKGFTPQVNHIRKLDQFSSELVNGDEGGTWAPADPIVVGPTGTPPTMTLNSGSVLSGNIETVDGNGAGAGPGETVGLIITGGAFPAFQTPRTRTIVVPLWPFAETTGPAVPSPPVLFGIDPVYLAATRIGSRGGSDSLGYSMLVPFPTRAQHRGSTIASVDFNFRVKAYHASLPTALPKFRIAKIVGSAFQFLHTVAGSYDASGWLTDSAASPAAYWNNGLTRTITYTPDQNNTNLDPTTGYYILEVHDENMNSNAELGNIYMSAVVHLTSIADYRQE